MLLIAISAESLTRLFCQRGRLTVGMIWFRNMDQGRQSGGERKGGIAHIKYFPLLSKMHHQKTHK